jgi:hypothetical protein
MEFFDSRQIRILLGMYDRQKQMFPEGVINGHTEKKRKDDCASPVVPHARSISFDTRLRGQNLVGMVLVAVVVRVVARGIRSVA